jgi:hypothetical protein
MKHWSAFLPLALSLAGLLLIFGHVAISGAGREADEGTAARVWWVLMAAQVPLVAYFAITRLPRAARTALAVLALQVAGVIANLAAVRYFDL